MDGDEYINDKEIHILDSIRTLLWGILIVLAMFFLEQLWLLLHYTRLVIAP